jgi:uncharacterized membrane protein (UPF0127 family)
MSRSKKMTLSILGAVVIFAIIVLAWWRVFFGMPNPPLPQTTVSIVSSSTATSSSSSSSPATNGAAIAPPAPAGILVAGENPPLATESLNIDKATFNVEIASTALSQTRGLSYRPSLGANDGMLFVFATGSVQTFWMSGMNFPLDMIWISGTTVVGFTQDIPAPASGTQLWQLPIYSSPAGIGTDKVLEVNSGTVAKYNIKTGDTVTIGGAE